MPSKPSSQQLAQMNALLRSPAVLARMQQIRSDPRYANSVPLQHNAINSWLFNDPSSPLYDKNQAGDRSSGSRGNGTYRYDIQTNSIKWEPLGPQHWYSDPGVVGPIAAGAAMGGFGLQGALGGAPSAPAAAPAASAGSAGALPSSSIPTSLAMHGPAAIASQGASAGIPLGGMMAGNQHNNQNGGDGGGQESVMDALKGILTNPNDLASLAAIIPALMGHSQGEKDAEQARRINAIAEARMRRADPLHQVAVNLAFGRMPTNYRQGVTLQNVPLPE